MGNRQSANAMIFFFKYIRRLKYLDHFACTTSLLQPHLSCTSKNTSWIMSSGTKKSRVWTRVSSAQHLEVAKGLCKAKGIKNQCPNEMFPQKSWATNLFHSCIKKKIKRICCNDMREDPILTLFKCTLCCCSEWSTTEHHIVLQLFFFFFNRTILSYFRATSAFRMTTGLSCTQARCDQGTGHWPSSGRWQDTFTFQLWQYTAPQQRPAAARDEPAASCDSPRQLVSGALCHVLLLSSYRSHKRGALDCDTFISELEERQSTAWVQPNTLPSPGCYLFASNMDMSAILKIKYFFFFFFFFNCLCGKWFLVKLQC